MQMIGLENENQIPKRETIVKIPLLVQTSFCTSSAGKLELAPPRVGQRSVLNRTHEPIKKDLADCEQGAAVECALVALCEPRCTPRTQREGPVREGSLCEASLHEGPLCEGPVHEGPLCEGPLHEGPFCEVPLHEGPPHEGSLCEGPLHEGPPHEGPVREVHSVRFHSMRVHSVRVHSVRVHPMRGQSMRVHSVR